MLKTTLKNKKVKYIVGIDEAGRGPLAGPIALGIFCVAIEQKNGLKKLFKGARDSKKISALNREKIFAKIKSGQETHILRYIVRYENAKNIDKKGISWCIRNCIAKGLKKLTVNPKQTLVLLDGSLKAPSEFIYQKTIIGGDDKELVISLASICAKVTRDAHLVKLGKKYPLYGLEQHKGYGTLAHRTAIQKHGASPIHRKTFLKNIMPL